MKSYFVDTNYFLRLLLKDNKEQFDLVYKLFKSGSLGEVRLFTSLVVFFEVYWVLASFYEQDKKACTNYLSNILKMDFLEIEDKEVLFDAVNMFGENNLGLEDCFNISYLRKFPEAEFATFDKKLLKYVFN